MITCPGIVAKPDMSRPVHFLPTLCALVQCCQIVRQAKSGDRLFNKAFFACLACLQAQFAGAARADHAGRQAAPQTRFLPESPT